MPARLFLVAGKVTDSVTYGFLPAAGRLGLGVTVLTDRPADHEKAYGSAGSYGPYGMHGPRERRISACEVTDFRAIIDVITRLGAGTPCAIFTNSDHLQAPAALAAAYFGLPGKDWRAATRTKNKVLMRRHLAEIDPVFNTEITKEPCAPPDAPYPLVLKPREGVASEDVFLVRDAAELTARYREIRGHRPDPLVAEEYLPGQLHTLETLGDGRRLQIVGSFRTAISPPPYFIEERLDWAPPPPETGQVLAQLAALGVGFGACHTEFVVHEGRARLIEVNYRIIGDHGDFLLADLLGVPIFEYVLRVHLGEPLGTLPGQVPQHAAVDNVIAERPGTLRGGPERLELEDGGVRLVYRPVRAPGDPIKITHTNRDYLGIIQAIGPGAAEVDAALARFRAAHAWEIA